MQKRRDQALFFRYAQLALTAQDGAKLRYRLAVGRFEMLHTHGGIRPWSRCYLHIMAE